MSENTVGTKNPPNMKEVYRNRRLALLLGIVLIVELIVIAIFVF
jgi:hypothetical protein